MLYSCKPILYCDVDGVINLSAKTAQVVREKTVLLRPPFIFRHLARMGPVPFKVRWRESMVETLSLLPVSLWWLTTWNQQAVKLLEPLTGIRSEGVLNYHLGVREIRTQPSKYTLLRLHQLADPRPFIWVDDIATQHYRESDWVNPPPHLIIRTVKNHGITDEHLEEMRNFISNTSSASQ